jgi:hypothetical protein
VYVGNQEKVERLIKVLVVCYFNAPHFEQLTGKPGFRTLHAIQSPTKEWTCWKSPCKFPIQVIVVCLTDMKLKLEDEYGWWGSSSLASPSSRPLPIASP